MIGGRRVTAAQRNYSAVDLQRTDRAALEQLVQLLLLAASAQVTSTTANEAYREWLFETYPLWRARLSRARLHLTEVSQTDVDRIAEVAAAESDADTYLFAAGGIADGTTIPASVAVISPEELIERLERSPLVVWTDGAPRPALGRLASFQDLEEQTALYDPVGIRWISSLALNELPPALAGVSGTPQDLLEQIAFRLFTGTFRFRGERYGALFRGKPLPDSSLLWPCESSATAALMDCKAASEGYVMSSDHELRFKRYVRELREGIREQGNDLRYFVVISSNFPGRTGEQHPYHARAAALKAEADVDLAYVRAEDLARFAAALEIGEASPRARERIDWSSVFDQGIVEWNHLETVMPDGAD